ncbi:MAG: ABC transporter ATP-binding protein, partial [Acidimicrobiaceae bacterium]|nr:ABC transporter ATP-binding protein [Acidimicrobiaceae bacterium]
MTALEVTGVSVRFGGHKALDEISVTVERGMVLGLIGPNGAGKTTLFNVVTGLLNPDQGRVALLGHDVTGLPPSRRARLGLARTFQRLELFTSLTVRDNIRVAGDIRNSWGRRQRIDIGKETDRVIALTGLGDVADRDVADIPTGRARVVEVARALMTLPSVLLLDEPAAGQTEQETEAFGQLLRGLAADGLAVCLVEHDMTLVMRVSDVIQVLDYGQTLARGAPE